MRRGGKEEEQERDEVDSGDEDDDEDDDEEEGEAADDEGGKKKKRMKRRMMTTKIQQTRVQIATWRPWELAAQNRWLDQALLPTRWVIPMGRYSLLRAVRRKLCRRYH